MLPAEPCVDSSTVTPGSPSLTHGFPAPHTALPSTQLLKAKPRSPLDAALSLPAHKTSPCYTYHTPKSPTLSTTEGCPSPRPRQHRLMAGPLASPSSSSTPILQWQLIWYSHITDLHSTAGNLSGSLFLSESKFLPGAYKPLPNQNTAPVSPSPASSVLPRPSHRRPHWPPFFPENTPAHLRAFALALPYLENFPQTLRELAPCPTGH